jgi:hypothetical protein
MNYITAILLAAIGTTIWLYLYRRFIEPRG